ncbi:hypothetical protein DMB44_01320 [Thermoplasma sp. Kam2015]|uniref:hypothetical protein n=1 Tax=Thermoplasma sp. Kam2015 TaxID=2094122 RepID=UPI000D87903C|nr:hypothetical protein [Thermoplasma sp. Kam2015]PYB68919.1 hypothetical protein DMB44_01320 [Thermoplasma sp. Kam2015]
MRKKILLIGLIIFIIGIAMTAGGDYLVGHYTVTSTVMMQSKVGMSYYEITIFAPSLLTVDSTFSPLYLVSSANLTGLNASNVASRSISPLTTTSVSSEHVWAYDLTAAGSYYIVAFNSSAAAITWSYIPLGYTYLSVVMLIGIVLIIVGIIIAVIGLILRKKQVPEEPQI